jgi:hypothetical protein
MKKYLAFDIEIAKVMPDDPADFKRYRPLGVTCAAALASTGEIKLWHGKDETGEPTEQMLPEELSELIKYLSDTQKDGFTIVTWNGLGFDFDILSEESGDNLTCSRLARSHIDMMFHLFCIKGYPLSLDNAAHGMGLPGKTPGMDGSLAPKYWRDGKYQQVLDYVAQDARTTLELAEKCDRRRKLSWTSRSGRPQTLVLPRGWLTVDEAHQLPLPDTSWMSNPWPRSKFTGWLDK